MRNGKIVYWGLTKNFGKRLAQHIANGRSFQIEREFTDLSRSAARGLEQFKIDEYGLKNLENAINGIATRNPQIAEYYREAIKYLKNQP